MGKLEFLARLRAAVDFERRVHDYVESHEGWDALSFGQDLLQSEARERLRKTACALRWLPDLLCSYRKRATLFLEVKNCCLNTSNWDIETASLDAQHLFRHALGCPIYFVFPDLTIASPDAVKAHCRPGPFRGKGSGTPFILTPKSKHTKRLKDLIKEFSI